MVALPIDKIVRRSDVRQINEATVSALADSISVVGLINPIRVRDIGGRWEVSAGSHRLAACEKLGLVDVECVVVDDDDLHAELAMIDENLMRAELSASERAVQTARRKAIYLELHPETAAGVAGALAKHGHANEKVSFAEETAAATGANVRTVQLHAERGEKVIPEVIALIAGTKLDTGTYLDKIKGMTPNDQVVVAKRDLARLREQEKAKPVQSRSSSSIDADVKSRAAKEVAEIIAEHVPGEWWDAVKSNLYASGAKNIGDALSNITGQSVMGRDFS